MNPAIQYGIDLALLAVIAAETLLNAKRGFVRSVLTLLATLLAFGVALKAGEPAASWSYDTLLDRMVCEKVEAHVKDFAEADTTIEIINETERIIPDYLNPILEKINVDLNEVSDRIDESSKSALTPQQISGKIIKPAAMVLLKPLCTLLCFGLLIVVLRLLISSACKAAKLPVLNTANKTLGAVLGLLKGLLIVYLLATFCSLVAQVTAKPQIKQAVDQSRIISLCQSIGKTGE